MKKLFESWRKHTATLTESSFTRFKMKIDEQRMLFLLISAYREGGNNQTAHQSLKSDLVSSGYSFTEVIGGGQEELKDDEGNFIMGDDDKPLVTNVREMTLLVTPERRGQGGEGGGGVEGTPEEIMALFETGKRLAKAYNQFAFIFGYPQEVSDPVSGESSTRMLIGAYTSEAPVPGEASRLKDDWAGPWQTIEQAAEDDVYYTKIAGTKGTLKQEGIRNRIMKIKLMETNNQFDRMKKNYHLKRWKSLLD